MKKLSSIVFLAAVLFSLVIVPNGDKIDTMQFVPLSDKIDAV
ncbi:hypothetical protein [Shouchella clausii]|nr:hypothetical protein [Shouchella clausii]